MSKPFFAGAVALSCAVLVATGAQARRHQDSDPVGDTPASVCGSTVFEDHFDGPSLNPAWQVLTNTNPQQGQVQVYEPSAVSLNRDGMAVTGTRGGPKGFISGRVQSAQTYRYGCFFVTARIPGGNGLWPALWMRTPNPANGELDILEERGARPGEFQGTIHHWQNGTHIDQGCALVRFSSTPPWPGADPCGGHDVVIPSSGDFTQSFHTYGVIWTPTQVTWLLDGRPYFSTTDRIPNTPMFMVLCLAIGGIIDNKHQPDASTPVPAVLQIRDVKITALR